MGGPSDRRLVAASLADNGRAPLAIRVRPAAEGSTLAADAALALSWELLAPEEDGAFPVRDGHLSVIREAVTDQAPALPAPSGSLARFQHASEARDNALLALRLLGTR
jgi:hypothetical protein